MKKTGAAPPTFRPLEVKTLKVQSDCVLWRDLDKVATLSGDWVCFWVVWGVKLAVQCRECVAAACKGEEQSVI